MDTKTIYPRSDEMTNDDTTRDDVSRASDSVVSGVRDVIRNAEDLLKTTADYSAEGFDAARSKLRESLEQAKLKLSDTQARVATKAEDAAVATKEYVTDNPWKSLAIVGSVGVILGMLMSRRP